MKRSRFFRFQRTIVLLLSILIAAFSLSPFSPACADVWDSIPGTDFGSDDYDPMLPSPSIRSGSNTGVQTSYVVPFQARVAVASARLRAYASVRAGLIENLPAGHCVVVIGQTTGADRKVWYQVKYGTWCGYIRYDQLEVLCGTAQLGGCMDPTPPCIGQTNTRAVNVRLGMSTSTARVRLLRRGQKVTLLGLCRDRFGVPWYYVCIPSGAIGYIRGEFVTVVSGTIAESVPCGAGMASFCSPDWADPCCPAGAASSCISGSLGSCIGSAPASSVITRMDPWPVRIPHRCGADALACRSGETASSEEELLYLRWISSHMTEISQTGDGYQGYSLYDLDGDGIHELLVSCSASDSTLWQIYTCEGESIIDLGQLSANGYYLAERGTGILLVSILSDSQTQYYRVMKVGNSLVTMYSLLRTADEAWHYTWTYNQKTIPDESLRMLLNDFTDDVLQNMGLYRGSNEVSFSSMSDNAR